MLTILLSTGTEGPRDWLANPPVIFGVRGAVVIGLWIAMLVAAFRRTR